MIIDAHGKFLVAPPGMPDPRFRKTVVFIWKHDIAGAAGVIINKRCQRPTFKHVCQEGSIQLKEGINPPVYYGGPILPNVVGVIHSTEYRLGSTNMLGDVGFTLDAKILQDVAHGSGPLNRIVTLGMCNWNPHQLEDEIENPMAPGMSWLMLDYDEKIIFGQLDDTKSDDIWEDCLRTAINNTTKELTNKFFKN